MADAMHGLDAAVIYATQGNVGAPGTAADRTALNARAVLAANAATGAGLTISAAAVTAARNS